MIKYPLIVPDRGDLYIIETPEKLGYVLEPNDVTVSGLTNAYDSSGRLCRLVVEQSATGYEVLRVEQIASSERQPEVLAGLIRGFLQTMHLGDARIADMPLADLMACLQELR